MGSDREARMLAAGDTIQVNGQSYTLRPVVAQNLCDLEREALKAFKKQYLETYQDNSSLLGDNAQDVLLRKIDEVAMWTLENLPQRDAFDCKRVPITEELRQRLIEVFGEEIAVGAEERTERGWRALTTHALDQGMLGSEEVGKLTGKNPMKGKVRFDQWWVTGMAEGMISFIHSSVKKEHPKVKWKDVASWPYSKLIEASRVVETVTIANLGNI